MVKLVALTLLRQKMAKLQAQSHQRLLLPKEDFRIP